MTSSEKEIIVKDLTFRYKEQKDRNAIEGINLEVEKGEFIVIMGPSGAGKSTLAQCLNGLIPHFTKGHYSGEVVVRGIKVKETPVSKMAKEIGFVFQDFEAQLFSTNTKLEIAFGPENFGVPREEIEEIIRRVLKIVNLEGLEDRPPSTLSGGQKQRLAIGSVLACMPSILCMDEPTTDLDPIGKIGVFNIARKLHEEKELTLIIIEHETEEALNADRIILMEKGKIIKDGKPREVLKEVDLMEKIGLMPLQIPKYFSQVSNLEKADLPLTYEEGVQKFKELGLQIDEGKYQEILRREDEREKSYGDVIIQAKDVEYVYSNGTKALDGINLEIREGEFIALLGHNGSGKTTLAKHFNCLLKPTRGSIIVYGKDTKNSNVYEIGNYVGYAFQNPDHQIFADTVYDEIAFGPRMRGCTEEEVKERVAEALKAVDMEGFEKEDPFALSKGERQRIAVASILAARPKVIILDEPTTGLDYKEQKRMMELVKRLNESGHTIIMITHTMWIVAEYAHKVAVMRDGKIEMYGKVRDVFKEEERLLELSLKPPSIVSLSNRLGKTFLSVEEMVSCTKR
ncbi:ABC transporter ATP-binding protein [Caldanaerobacter subterraneus]|uniref:Energy-coupling factor ABC transporter ATP-binding protein n=1 Tax=Caldanaerobacter subterraneus TaxID=911092 RepID=A0A7Y2PKY9_9THEO|nr:ABC transporter ATP-binding protein [Caldanaerobacter subterraneus]NNG67509.1 energy-coupling factor ABC transporter ATP-binding protein [Caldanaerobacter subterraneus]